MKLTYYGTAAAEGVPALWCDCDTCTKARTKGGRNVRTRSQALIDDAILIDLPADTYHHVLSYGLPLHKIDACIITHNHSDHLYPKELHMRHEGFAHLRDGKPFKVYGTETVIVTIQEALGDVLPAMELSGEIELHTIRPYEPFCINGYEITALEADHGAPQSVFYIIEKDDRSVLYAHDTGIFPENAWDYLSKLDICFDIVSLDCTNVLLQWDNKGHMGLNGNAPVKKRLEEMGLVDKHTKCIVNHFSHNGLAGYDELVPHAEAKGFAVSYDTMEVETDVKK